MTNNDQPTVHATIALPETGQPEQPQEDLERVREIILGADATRQRLRRPEVERLREILFGAQMEEYARHFADLSRSQEHLNADLRQAQDRIAEFEKKIARRLDSLELDIRRLTDDLRRETDRQRSREATFQQLANQVRQHEQTIVGIGDGLLDLRKTSANHETEIRAGKHGLVDTHDQIEQRTQALRHEIREAEDLLRTELRRIADRLEYQKTDRKALAGMLIEIATRLETGNTMTGLLENLAAPKE